MYRFLLFLNSYDSSMYFTNIYLAIYLYLAV